MPAPSQKNALRAVAAHGRQQIPLYYIAYSSRQFLQEMFLFLFAKIRLDFEMFYRGHVKRTWESGTKMYNTFTTAYIVEEEKVLHHKFSHSESLHLNFRACPSERTFCGYDTQDA